MAPAPAEKKEEDSNNAKAAPVSPSMLIVNNPQYFNKLFDLLTVEEIDREKV